MDSKHEMLIMALLCVTLEREYEYVSLLLFYGLVYVRGMFTKAFKVNLACYTKMSFSACFPNVLLK